jgi:hypothetical protein
MTLTFKAKGEGGAAITLRPALQMHSLHSKYLWMAPEGTPGAGMITSNPILGFGFQGGFSLVHTPLLVVPGCLRMFQGRRLVAESLGVIAPPSPIKVEGVGVFMVTTGDLAQSMGLVGQVDLGLGRTVALCGGSPTLYQINNILS